MEEGPVEHPGDCSFAPRIAGGAMTGNDERMRELPRENDARLPLPAGIVTIGGITLRYRCDPRRPWSHLHFRHEAIATRTGRRIGDDRPGVDVPEVLLSSPWGELHAVLWNLGPDLDLIVGREALGRPSPSPWRPFFPHDGPQILVDKTDRAVAPPAPFHVGRLVKDGGGGQILQFRIPVQRRD